MDRDQAKQAIRDRVKCTDYLTKSKDGLYCCPFCGSGNGPHGTGAVKYYPDTNTWHCHRCGKGGDIFDLYQQATGEDFKTAIDSLARIAGIDISGPAPQPKPAGGPQSAFDKPGGHKQAPAQNGPANSVKTATEARPDYAAYYEDCRNRLQDPEGEPGQAYLRERGIFWKTAANRYGIGFDPKENRIIIPCSDRFYIARSIDPRSNLRYKNPKNERPTIFNAAALHAQDVQEVFIVEGAFDALSIESTGAAAVALNSTANTAILIRELEQAPTAATLILCLDNDEAGRKAEKTLQEGLQRLNIPFITADINNGRKDPNDSMIEDYDSFCNGVQDAIYTAKDQRQKQLEAARQEELTRQQRTGAGMIDAFLQAVKTRKYEPIPTGITDIDQALSGGFTRQTLILLGAAPGAGKTALAQWIFEGMAKRGTACLYLNLEMSREQILARSIARIAAQRGEKITPAEIKQGYKWDAAQEAIVMAAAQEYKETIAPRMIYNPLEATDLDAILQYMEAEATRAEAAGLPAPLVVLDYLQIVTGREREDEVSLIKRAVSSLKAFAIKHNTVVFCIIAHNRAANQSGNVTMESGRDTSALEYSADLQLGLAFTMCLKRNGLPGKAREELTPEETRLVTLKITKGRDARIGAEVDLAFDGETMTYTQIEKGREEPPAQRWMQAPTMRL